MTPPEHDVLRIETIPVEACSDGTVVAMVTINRPNKLNALNADVTLAMKEMVAWVESEDLVRCLIITGAQPLEPDEGKRALQAQTSLNSSELEAKRLQPNLPTMRLKRYGM